MFGGKKYNEGEPSLAQKIANGKINIWDLDLENSNFFLSALDALDLRKNLAKELNPKYPEQKKLIIAWLSRPTPLDVEAFVDEASLLPLPATKIPFLDADKMFSDETHDNDIIKAYLNIMLSNGDRQNEFKLYQSFDKELVIRLDYETKNGEEIVYRDKELEIPLYMTAKLALSLKIVDPYEFIKYMDINLQQISVDIFLSKLTPTISNVLRNAILKVVEENALSYYDFTKYYVTIAKLVQNELNSLISGVQVSDTYLKNTCILNGADKIFEEKRIEFMQRENDLALQHKAELMSLENYAKKAEIHSKYPDYEMGLTEKEKDNAVDRYLIKQSGVRNDNIKSAETIELRERKDNLMNIAPLNEVYEADPVTNKISTGKEITFTVLGFILFLIAMISGTSFLVRFLLIAVAILFVGFSLASIVNKCKMAKIAEEEHKNAE